MKNPDTGNLKFKFEILQGGENFQDESNNHNQGKIGGLTFLFLFTALIGLCNRYSRSLSKYKPHLFHFRFSPTSNNSESILAFEIFILVSRCVFKAVLQTESFLLFYFNLCETFSLYLVQS